MFKVHVLFYSLHLSFSYKYYKIKMILPNLFFKLMGIPVYVESQCS